MSATLFGSYGGYVIGGCIGLATLALWSISSSLMTIARWCENDMRDRLLGRSRGK